MTIDPLLSVSDVATVLGTSKKFVYGLCQRGELPSVKVSNLVRVREQDLEAYIEQQGRVIRPPTIA